MKTARLPYQPKKQCTFLYAYHGVEDSMILLTAQSSYQGPTPPDSLLVVSVSLKRGGGNPLKWTRTRYRKIQLPAFSRPSILLAHDIISYLTLD